MTRYSLLFGSISYDAIITDNQEGEAKNILYKALKATLNFEVLVPHLMNTVRKLSKVVRCIIKTYYIRK